MANRQARPAPAQVHPQAGNERETTDEAIGARLTQILGAGAAGRPLAQQRLCRRASRSPFEKGTPEFFSMTSSAQPRAGDILFRVGPDDWPIEARLGRLGDPALLEILANEHAPRR